MVRWKKRRRRWRRRRRRNGAHGPADVSAFGVFGSKRAIKSCS